MAKKRVGVTGAGGTIGKILQDGLGGAYDLVLYDRQETRASRDWACRRIDFGERDGLEGVFEGLDALVHLAGDPRPNAPRQSTLRNNFAATSHVFEEAKRARIGKVVFASSNFYHEEDIGKVLAGKGQPLITLDRNPTPRCLYGESKVFGENVGRHLSHFGIRFAALRIGWAVPGDDPAHYGGAYMRAVYCSHRDLVQAFSRALEVDAAFLAAFAVSNNTRGVFDLAETRRLLGFSPLDNAEDHF